MEEVNMRMLGCLAALALTVELSPSGERAVAHGADAPAAGTHTLWYRHPAPQWDHALTLGNGRLGAMVFGNVNRERIQLNENTLWMGSPRETDNPEALANLPEVRRLLFAGQPLQAYALAERTLMGRPFRLESYQTLGDLRLWFDHEGATSDYRLELDLDTAIVRVTYRLGAVRFTREIFASHPAQAIVMRVSADTPGQVSMSTWIERLQEATTEIVGNDRLDLVGALGGGRGLSFQASVKVIADGGRLETFPERIYTEKADAVTLIVTAATSYRGRDPRRACERSLAAAMVTPYERLKAEHVADHQRLFRRVDLRLGAATGADAPLSLPIDERLARVKRGEKDLGLDALYFQFGRYLLIASSRPGNLPANLQGLWNDSMSPPWDSDYHLNINLQMNYWPAEVTNLAEHGSPDHSRPLLAGHPRERDPGNRRRAPRTPRLCAQAAPRSDDWKTRADPGMGRGLRRA